MFSKIAFALSTLTVLAAAIPTPGGYNSVSQCNTSGYAACCNSATNVNDPAMQATYGLLGIDVGSLTNLIGLGCSPIVPIGGSACSQRPVCCQGSQQNGLVNVQCVDLAL